MPPKAQKGEDLSALRAESAAVATELLGEAFDQAIHALEEKRLAQMLPHFAATQLRGSILQALELFHVSADPGEADVLDTTWTADREPEPVINDTWSRLVFAQLGPEAKRGCVKKSASRLPKAVVADDDDDGRRSSVDSTTSFQRQQAAFSSSSSKLFNAPAPPIAKEDMRKPISNAEVDAEAKGVPPRCVRAGCGPVGGPYGWMLTSCAQACVHEYYALPPFALRVHGPIASVPSRAPAASPFPPRAPPHPARRSPSVGAGATRRSKPT